ncbi:hypothetical protein FKP32DRAFT_1590975 [Trametes sanguinea]|nr:hypothetical protein FKP32DRAFT_1590975 [Trametes sanguinea]
MSFLPASSCPPDDESSLEPTRPLRIGAGSFASIYAIPGRSIVCKVVHVQEQAAQIKAEYDILHDVHTRCRERSPFVVPRALACFDPHTRELLFRPLPRRRGLPPGARAFDPAFFADLPPRACYVMDRVAPLPPRIARFIRASVYPAKASGAPAPLICRLYFGKQMRPSAFVNPHNFPVDVSRYERLRKEFPEDLLPVEEVVEGMAATLSGVHWDAGYDARDVEFVMAGVADSAMVGLYLIDFNQTRSFDKSHADVTALVEAFFINDPYYPRPIPGDPLYETFN